jgi:hypothetical protein
MSRGMDSMGFVSGILWLRMKKTLEIRILIVRNVERLKLVKSAKEHDGMTLGKGI